MASTTQDLQDQVLSTIRKGQEMALDGLKTWVENAQSVTASIPSVSLPLADRLPSPHDVVARGFDIAEQILANQRKFTDEVLQIASPLLPGDSKTAPKSAAK